MSTAREVSAAARRALVFPMLPIFAAVACSTAPAPSTASHPRGADSVAIGYGKVPRDLSTVAVSTLTSRELDGMRVSRIEELIQGRVSGAQVVRAPNGDYSIRIRNASSLMPNGNSDPLIVLDGMPMMNRGLSSVLDGVLPYDIARIDVLKDAGATAAYGSRGANGVILISTKRSRHAGP